MPAIDLGRFTACGSCDGAGGIRCDHCGGDGRSVCPGCGSRLEPCSDCGGSGNVSEVDPRLPGLVAVVAGAFDRLRRVDGFDCALFGRTGERPSRLRPWALLAEGEVWLGAVGHGVHDGPLQLVLDVLDVLEPVLPVGAVDRVVLRLVEAGAAVLEPHVGHPGAPPIADHPWLVPLDASVVLIVR